MKERIRVERVSSGHIFCGIDDTITVEVRIGIDESHGGGSAGWARDAVIARIDGLDCDRCNLSR